MDILDFAIQMEKDGEAYYREIAEGTKDKGMKNIFTMLADEEVKHAEVLNEMKSGAPEPGETKVLSDVKNIFARMREEKEHPDIDTSQIDMYRKALELEGKSKDFYLEKSNEVEDLLQKGWLLKLADEESKHYFILENIIEFVSRPDTWLENSEFVHLEDY